MKKRTVGMLAGNAVWPLLALSMNNAAFAQTVSDGNKGVKGGTADLANIVVGADSDGGTGITIGPSDGAGAWSGPTSALPGGSSAGDGIGGSSSAALISPGSSTTSTDNNCNQSYAGPLLVVPCGSNGSSTTPTSSSSGCQTGAHLFGGICVPDSGSGVPVTTSPAGCVPSQNSSWTLNPQPSGSGWQIPCVPGSQSSGSTSSVSLTGSVAQTSNTGQ